MVNRLDLLEKGLVDSQGVAVRAELTEDGKELGDPVPLAPPAHLRRSLTIAEQMQQMIRREFSMRAMDDGLESFEEADDFDVDDDPPDPHTPYEAVFDPPPPVKEKDDGAKSPDKGRGKPAGGGSGKSGKVAKGQPGPVEDADDDGSGGSADSGSGETED